MKRILDQCEISCKETGEELSFSLVPNIIYSQVLKGGLDSWQKPNTSVQNLM